MRCRDAEKRAALTGSACLSIAALASTPIGLFAVVVPMQQRYSYKDGYREINPAGSHPEVTAQRESLLRGQRTEMNEFATKVLHEVSENPGTVFNPLFILGSSAYLKRDLLLAIESEIARKHNDVHTYREDLSALIETERSITNGCNVDVFLFDNVTLDAHQMNYVKAKLPFLKHELSLNKQIVCVMNMLPYTARQRVSVLCEIPDRGIFLDIDEE